MWGIVTMVYIQEHHTSHSPIRKKEKELKTNESGKELKTN